MSRAHAVVETDASARAAGLHHVDDRRPGLQRHARGKIRQGKRWVTTFAITDAKGHAVRDAATLDRIRKLAIPPAWTDVWICPDARGHIQATGRDARGRKQYRYHARWREERDSTKFSRMLDFGRALPALRRRGSADLRLPGLPRRKVLATVVRLLQTTFIRVGNEEYARSNHSFGLTTLKDRHVDVRPAEVRFHFRGKSGVYHEISLHDSSIARIVRRCRDLPGHELFKYIAEDGSIATIGSADVNAYIHEIAGAEFTAKDFRTWAGTVLAAMALQQACAEVPVKGKAARKPNHRGVVRAIEQVAQRLGNTPSVCRKSYVHPHVVDAYLEGAFDRLASVHDGTAQLSSAGQLTTAERLVLSLLRKRAGEEKKGTRLEHQLRASLRAA
ncbi:MAG TPA: DNA topoisomerase IB [Polyangia bacterium]|nr:DNA topoisomerase IB [Polyangia bacterium]